MLDQKKIKLMIKMAEYEKSGAEEDLKISSYYKKDYVSMKVWMTAIWITIGYGILMAFFMLCSMETLLDGLTITKLLILIGAVLTIYVILMTFYCVYAGEYYKKKHNKAKQHAKKYYRDLSRLEKMNMKEKQ